MGRKQNGGFGGSERRKQPFGHFQATNHSAAFRRCGSRAAGSVDLVLSLLIPLYIGWRAGGA